ncbi:MAG: bacteriophage antitermination protein Q [Gammaproteobacteria bacterium]|nr:bacteriophage antitermination protein Q [Gammaproteobacteria bacterium]
MAYKLSNLPRQYLTAGNGELEWARLCVFRAHSVHVKKTSFDRTQYCASRGTRSKSKEAFCREWFQSKGIELRNGKSLVPLPPWAFEDSRIVRAVNTLPDGLRGWLKFAYTDSYTWEDEAAVVIALWDQFKPQANGLRDDTIKKLKGMAHLCVQDLKNITNRGKPLYPPARIRQLLGVPRGNWRRDWLPRWQRMQEILFELDRQALIEVLGVVDGRYAA